MAPESFSTDTQLTDKCDVWAIGIIMYYLATGKVPFYG